MLEKGRLLHCHPSVLRARTGDTLMSLGIRFRGLSCPSCGCSGEGPPSVASCLCTACKMPASITVNSIYGMIATGSVFVGNLTNTAVQLFGSGTLTYDPTISLPPCLETPEGVDGCWYGPFSDSSYDSTLWGGRAGSGSVYNTGCDLVNTTTVYTVLVSINPPGNTG